MKLKITVDGKVYEVDVEVAEPDPQPPGHFPPLAARVPASAPPLPNVLPSTTVTPVADEKKVCRSPFAGTVSKVAVKTGQSIQVNDTLLVLEAMKMETVITAPVAGKIAKANVNVGDAVKGGQVLVEFE